MTVYYKYIPAAKLKFSFLRNPRFKGSEDFNNPCDLNDYINEFCIRDLVKSLVFNGYFETEPIVVYKINAIYYKVIDGNRRLFAINLINDPGKIPAEQTTIKKIVESQFRSIAKVPCLVGDCEKILERQAGYKHMHGGHLWLLEHKAKWINEVTKDDDYNKLPFDEKITLLAKLTGNHRKYISGLLKTYKIYQELDGKNFNSLYKIVKDEMNK